MRVNVEEMIFLAAIEAVTKEAAVQDILSRFSYMESPELKEISDRVLRKLEAMSDEEYAAIDLEDYREE